MMMFSTANFSKIMPCFLVFHQHYKQEWIPVLPKLIHTNIWPQKCTQGSSAPSTPRTLLFITGSAMPTAALFTSPRSSIFQEGSRMHTMGRSKTWRMHTKWPARIIQPQRHCECSDWVDTHPAVEPVQNCIGLKACRAGQGEHAEMGAGDWKHIS